MKTAPLRLLVCAMLLLSGGSGRRSAPVEILPTAEGSQPDKTTEQPPEEPPVQAATPEDPGPIATVVGPLAVWQKRAEALKQAELVKQAAAAKPPVEEPVPQEPQPADHVVFSASPEPNHFLHQVFAVRKYSEFAFVVPPNILNPKLQGNYRSFVKSKGAGSKAADVDVMLLNERQFSDFANGRPGNATYEINSSHNRAVDYAVPPTHDRAQPYHLVFRSPEGSPTRFVDADFTVSFE